MLSVVVVEVVDVLEHFVLHVPSSFNIRAVNEFSLKRMEGTFSNGIVTAVPRCPRTLTGLQQAKGLPIHIRRILHLLVGMDNQSWLWATPGYS